MPSPSLGARGYPERWRCSKAMGILHALRAPGSRFGEVFERVFVRHFGNVLQERVDSEVSLDLRSGGVGLVGCLWVVGSRWGLACFLAIRNTSKLYESREQGLV